LIIAGAAVVGAGMLMVLLGFAMGAYGAFCEDSLYGMLYLVFPLYTAYYMVTRFEDLWVWFTCSTIGVVLVALGGALAQWGGLQL
jgi:hypothetical protein